MWNLLYDESFSSNRVPNLSSPAPMLCPPRVWRVAAVMKR